MKNAIVCLIAGNITLLFYCNTRLFIRTFKINANRQRHLNSVQARKDSNLIIITPRNSLKFALNTGMRSINFSMSKFRSWFEKLGVMMKLKFKREARLEEKG